MSERCRVLSQSDETDGDYSCCLHRKGDELNARGVVAASRRSLMPENDKPSPEALQLSEMNAKVQPSDAAVKAMRLVWGRMYQPIGKHGRVASKTKHRLLALALDAFAEQMQRRTCAERECMVGMPCHELRELRASRDTFASQKLFAFKRGWDEAMAFVLERLTSPEMVEAVAATLGAGLAEAMSGCGVAWTNDGARAALEAVRKQLEADTKVPTTAKGET